MKEDLQRAIALRKDGHSGEALVILSVLLQNHPEDPTLNYQTAWTYDSLGKEREAVPFYEKALAIGLSSEDRKGALLGLGSTCRCLGQYQKSSDVFSRAIKEFPEDRSFKVFNAITLYNLNQSREAVSQLLIELIETTSDPSIKKYEKALRFYSDKLDQTWE
ncbi:MAG: tetratricopeptide repeat protein [Bdellovibrionota bacterium]